VPAGRAINPITHTNWEGVGIEPDVKVPAPLALKTAHLDALQKIAAAETDARRRGQLEQAIADVQKELDALKAPKASS
jgi:C-terminal processing protease CtpA/Prc